MKKRIILILLFMISICLFSCSKSEPKTSEGEEKVETIETDYSPNTEESVLVLDDIEEVEPVNKRYINTEIRIRSEASANGEIVGHVYEEEIYEVLDSKKDDKYTWYKIGENKWIADDGTWTFPVQIIKFKSNNGTKEEYIFEYASEMEYRSMDYLVLNKNRFTTPDYVFVGWNTSPNGSGTYYYEDEYIKDVIGQSKAICLYAQWQPIINQSICVKADGDIELWQGPSIKNRKYMRGIIKKDDCFEIIEQINYNDKTWNRISKDIWFIESEGDYSVIELLPTIHVDFKEFPKPVKVSFGSESEILKYNGDELISIEKSENYYGNTGTDTWFSLFTSWMFPDYRYGPGVTTKYDENGRISEQTVTAYNSTIHQTYTYDSYNRIKSKDEWYKSPKDSGNLVIYEYYNDGKLKRFYLDPGSYSNKYTWGSEFEYNGNLVFQYDFFYYVGKEKETSYSFEQLLRYDDLGRLIQIYYPDSPQIEGPMVTDYYY